MKFKRLYIFILMFLPIKASTANNCTSFLDSFFWQSSEAKIYFSGYPTGRLLKVYNRPSSRHMDNWYPDSLSVNEIIEQDQIQMHILAQLMWRLRSKFKVTSARSIKTDNEFQTKLQMFDSKTHKWTETESIAPSLEYEYTDGVRLAEIIDWVGGGQKSPASWLEKSFAIDKINEYNFLVEKLAHQLNVQLKDKIRFLRIELEHIDKIGTKYLEVTLIDPRSLIKGGRISFLISPSNVLLTKSGDLILFSSL